MEKIYVPTVSFPREQHTSVSEHEILMSFNNDSDTEYFEQWWNDFGEMSYAKYLEKMKNDVQF